MYSWNLFQDQELVWFQDVLLGSVGLTVADNRRLVDDISWWALWFRTVGSLGLTR